MSTDHGFSGKVVWSQDTGWTDNGPTVSQGDPDPHAYVYVTVTDPMGGTHGPVYIGSLPVWAAESADSFTPWKRARRSMVLDSISMSERSGFRFQYATHAWPID